MNLGEIIKFMRTDIFSISLLDFGEILNLSSSTLQRYESNDFGKKFSNNKYIKLKDIAERIADAVFNEHTIIRKSKKYYVNNNNTKLGFNKKIKAELSKLYQKSNNFTNEKFNKLVEINIDTEKCLSEYIYTFFLFYMNIEVVENISFDNNIAKSILKVTDTNKDRISDYKKCLTEATGNIFITGTSMVHLSEDSGHILKEKAKSAYLKLLILDPDWIDKNSSLLTFLEYDDDRKTFSYEIRNSIRKINAIKRSLDYEISSKILIKKYSTIFPYIITGYEYKNEGKIVVEITDYLPDNFRPRLTIQKNNKDNLYNIIKKKFDSLWNDKNLTKEV